MKLYDFPKAPSPRRVRIFAAEKGLALTTVEVNLRQGEQFSQSYRSINPQCVVPFLVLDDGTGIGEVVAICRYLEEIAPSPPLLGTDPTSKALVAMWDHRMEVEGFAAVAEVLRNSAPTFRGRALTGPLASDQIPPLADRGRARVAAFFDMLDRRLAESSFVAGPSFSMADITALVSVDFADRVKIPAPEGHIHLKRWHENVSLRPSATA